MTVDHYRLAALNAFRRRHTSPGARRAASFMIARASQVRRALRTLGVEA